MDIEDMKKYVEEHRRFEMPDFQEHFSVSYSKTDKTLEFLQKGGIIKFCGGFMYEAANDAGEEKTESVYVPKDEQEAFFIKALWECVKRGDVSTSLIQRRLSCGYARAAHAIDWMEENDFVDLYPNRKVKMSVEEYYVKFGNPDKVQEQSEDEERERYIEERRRALMERLSRMSDDDDSDEDDENEENDSDENENDDDEDRNDAPDNNVFDFRSILIECLERGLQNKSDDDKYILGLDGEPKFEFKFVNEGCSLKISDGGETLTHISQTKRKIKNILKSFAPVKLVDDEISITIDNPYSTLIALLMLFSAIEAVRKMK